MLTRLDLRRWGRCTLAQRYIGCDRGSSAVEFSMLLWPLVLILLGSFQFYALHTMQTSLSDALFQWASKPACQIDIINETSTRYKNNICDKTAFPTTCKANIKIEMSPIQTFTTPPSPILSSPIKGTNFNVGSGNDVLIVRASVIIDQFLPASIPLFTARAAAVVRRPSANTLKTCS